MKIEEPTAMREIHEIRIRMWEETKHLSTKEKIKKINELADKFIKENNLEDRVVSFVKGQAKTK